MYLVHYIDGLKTQTIDIKITGSCLKLPCYLEFADHRFCLERTKFASVKISCSHIKARLCVLKLWTLKMKLTLFRLRNFGDELLDFATLYSPSIYSISSQNNSNFLFSKLPFSDDWTWWSMPQLSLQHRVLLWKDVYGQESSQGVSCWVPCCLVLKF